MSYQKDKEAIEAYLIKKMWPLGQVRLVGSAAKGRVYINNHDIDVLLFTDISDGKIIINYLDSFIKEWLDLFALKLDLFVYGNFSESYYEGYTKSKTFNAIDGKRYQRYALSLSYTIRFGQRRKRRWHYMRIMAMKFWRSLLKGLES